MLLPEGRLPLVRVATPLTTVELPNVTPPLVNVTVPVTPGGSVSVKVMGVPDVDVL